MRTLHKHTKAFTMIELVFVIVVLGILASLALPRMDRDLRQEAKDNILAAIRYTQHLALNDDKTDPTDATWQKKLWKITFSSSTIDNLDNYYTISSDANKDGAVADPAVDSSEVAIDPANGKFMFTDDSTIDTGESPNIFIGRTYGIKGITFSGGCSNNDPKHIGFDYLGRPHNGIGAATNNYSQYMATDCTIQFIFADGSTPLTVTIATETGHVSAD